MSELVNGVAKTGRHVTGQTQPPKSCDGCMILIFSLRVLRNIGGGGGGGGGGGLSPLPAHCPSTEQPKPVLHKTQ